MITNSETANLAATLRLADKIAADFTHADVNRIDRIMDDKIIPSLMAEYSDTWDNLPFMEQVFRVSKCIHVMMEILSASSDPDKRFAASLLRARAEQDF